MSKLRPAAVGDKVRYTGAKYLHETTVYSNTLVLGKEYIVTSVYGETITVNDDIDRLQSVHSLRCFEFVTCKCEFAEPPIPAADDYAAGVIEGKKAAIAWLLDNSCYYSTKDLVRGMQIDLLYNVG